MNKVDYINKLEQLIKEKNLKEIKKNKFDNKRILKNVDTEEEFKQKHNYLIRLLKKINKQIKSRRNFDYIVFKDKNNNLVCLNIEINTNQDVYINVDIKLITGYINDSIMSCSYYNNHLEGILHIDSIYVGKLRCNHGNIILKALDENIDKINKQICIDNKCKPIKRITGEVRAYEKIIKQDDLVSFYKKYGFVIKSENKLYMQKILK